MNIAGPSVSGPSEAAPLPLWAQLLQVAVRMTGVPLGLWSLREAVRATSHSSIDSAMMIPFYMLFGLTIIVPWNWMRTFDSMRTVCFTLTLSGALVFAFGFHPAFRRVPVHGLEELLGAVLLSIILTSLLANIACCWLELARRSRDG